MADITGVLAKIKITDESKLKFYKEKGQLLLTDYFCIKKSYENSLALYEEQKTISDRQISDNPMSISEYMNAINVLEAKYKIPEDGLCNPEDLLIIRYDIETGSLFYFQQFRYDGIANLHTSKSLQTFLGHISEYKDIESEDFIFFSNCATDLMHSQFYKIWTVEKEKITELELKEWNPKWNEKLSELDLLSKKYYFDIIEKYTKFDEAQGVYFTDDEGLDKELERSVIDKELLENSF